MPTIFSIVNNAEDIKFLCTIQNKTYSEICSGTDSENKFNLLDLFNGHSEYIVNDFYLKTKAKVGYFQTYSMTCLITTFTLIMINLLSIIIHHNVITEADIDLITPSDFTLFVKGVNNDYTSIEELKQKFEIVNYLKL